MAAHSAAARRWLRQVRNSRTGLRLAANGGKAPTVPVRFGFGPRSGWAARPLPSARACASPAVQRLGAAPLANCQGAASTRPPARAATNLTVRSWTGLYVLKRLLATSNALAAHPGCCIRGHSGQRIRQLLPASVRGGQSAIAICNGGSTTGYQRVVRGLAEQRSVRACARAGSRAPSHLSRGAHRADRRSERASKITSLHVMLTVRLPTGR